MRNQTAMGPGLAGGGSTGMVLRVRRLALMDSCPAGIRRFRMSYPGRHGSDRRGLCATLHLSLSRHFAGPMEAAPQIRIGTAGWSYKDWEGVFYPPELQRKKVHALEYLAHFFDVVEINTSFYGHIKPELAKVWIRKVAFNPNFMFTAKLHRSFTHSPLAVTEPTSAASIRPTDEDEAKAREGLDVLAAAGKLAALLIQFPVSYKNTGLNREYLETLLRQFIEYPRVVEVRHDSWNNPETLASFARGDVAFCNIDQPVIGNSLEPTEHVTSRLGYVRLHGRNYQDWFDSDDRNDRYNYLYSESELGAWKEKIESVAEKAQTTYVIANNHYEARAGTNALELKSMLTGKRVKAPPELINTYPELKKFADPDHEASDPNLSLLA
jgi:uncharacterized protein YecE (DUF72 family)